jgi:hypothetical protein
VSPLTSTLSLTVPVNDFKAALIMDVSRLVIISVVAKV